MNNEFILNLDPVKDKDVLYSLLSERGINFKKTNCKRCLRDYKNILLEELGLIEDAYEHSQFNTPECDLVYVHPRTVSWNGYFINKSTPCEIAHKFNEIFPNYYKRINNEF